MNSIKHRGFKLLVCTRSMNLNLYIKSMSLINIKSKKRFTKTTADGYLFELIKQKVDFIINIDEDAFVINQKAIITLLDYMIDNEYVNCGMPDGGVLSIRFHHPIVTNPFFNILHVSKIFKHLNFHEIENIDFENSRFLENFPLKLTEPYSLDNFEPYNKLFVWIGTNFKTLYLNAKTHKDGYSTILCNHEGVEFIYHSWYKDFMAMMFFIQIELIVYTTKPKT